MVSQELLDILRCPNCVRNGPEAGLLEHKQKLMQGGYVAIRREANKIMYTEDRSSRGGKNQRFWAAAILKVLNKRRRISRIEMPPAKIG